MNANGGRDRASFGTRVTVATPDGRGAVATVVVDGPEAERLLAACFTPAVARGVSQLPIDAIVFGHWHRVDGEEVVVCRVAGGRIEIHCHGGNAASEAIVADLVRAGAVRSASPVLIEASRLAIESEAMLQLPRARTFRAAAILWDQSCGALRHAILAVLAHLSAGNLGGAWRELQTLLGRAALGRHLVEPFRVVIAGPPNAGKSSLINALLGYDRSLVFDQPGTTRDVVSATTAFEGWPVELVDTAGLRAAQEPIEAAGVDRARQQLRTADAQLIVFDGAAPWAAENDALVADCPDAIVVHNKSDIAIDRGLRPSGLWISAMHGDGIGRLIEMIASKLVMDPIEPGAALPFTQGQIDVLQAASVAIGSPQSGASAASSLLTDLL